LEQLDILTIRGSALKALGEHKGSVSQRCQCQVHLEIDGCSRLLHPNTSTCNGQTFLDANRRCVWDKGHGTVATDRVEQRIVKVGDTVDIIGTKEETHSMMVTEVEMFQKILDQGEAGENVEYLHWPNNGLNKLLQTQLIVSFGELKP
jgi:elongation factor Tu